MLLYHMQLLNVYAVGIFSKDEKPFGISYDDLASKFWNHWIAKNTDQATPKLGGSLIVNNDNKPESMVMLMETAYVTFPTTQVCKISSNQGILVPMWIGWCDTGSNGKTATEKQLAVCKRTKSWNKVGC